MRFLIWECVLAISIKLICLVLVAVGLANMWLAVFADVGVMIIAVLNAIRALFVKKLCVFKERRGSRESTLTHHTARSRIRRFNTVV